MNWLVIGLILLVIIIIITIIIFKPRTGGVEFIDKGVNANITMIKEWTEKKDKPLSEVVYTSFNSIYLIVKSYADQSDTNIERNCLLEICNHYNKQFENYIDMAKKTFINMTTLPMTTSLDKRCIEYCTKIVETAETCIKRVRITKFSLANTDLKREYENIIEKLDEHGYYDLDDTVWKLKDWASVINQINDLILINIENLLKIDELLDISIQRKKRQTTLMPKEPTTLLSEIKINDPTKEFIDSMNTNIEKCKSDFSMTTLNNVILEYTRLKSILWTAETIYIFQLYLLEQYWNHYITLFENDIRILRNDMEHLIIDNIPIRRAAYDFKHTQLDKELYKICTNARDKDDANKWDVEDHFELLKTVELFKECKLKKLLLSSQITISKDRILQNLDLIVLSNEPQKFIDYQKTFIEILYNTNLDTYKSIKTIKRDEKYLIFPINFDIKLFNAINNNNMVDRSKIKGIQLTLEFYKKCNLIYSNLFILIKKFIDNYKELFNYIHIDKIDDIVLFDSFDNLEKCMSDAEYQDVKPQINIIYKDILNYYNIEIYKIFEKIQNASVRSNIQIKYSKQLESTIHYNHTYDYIKSYKINSDMCIKFFDESGLKLLGQEYKLLSNNISELLEELDTLSYEESLSNVKEKIDNIKKVEIRTIYQSFGSYNFDIPQYKTELKQITDRLYPIIDEEIDKISKMSE